MCYISNTDGDEPFFAFYLLTMYSGLYKSNNPVEHDLYQILQTRIFSKKAVDFFSWSDRNPSVFTGKMGVKCPEVLVEINLYRQTRDQIVLKCYYTRKISTFAHCSNKTMPR